jgi:mRNA interferase RelE/StbE
MTYKLTFLEPAKKEWDRLSKQIQIDFKKKLSKRLENPIILKDKLSGLKDCYKIKLRTVGYRLIYKVYEDRVVVQVIAVAKRDKDAVYKLAKLRV